MLWIAADIFLTMSIHFQLIQWNLLTTTFDSLRYEEINKLTMTYLDLLQQLHELPKEKLQQTVTIYDKDCEEYIPTDSTLYVKNDKVHLQI